MIVTDLEHAAGQLPAGSLMRRALEFLRRKDLLTLPDGRVGIDGERVFAIVQRYTPTAAPGPEFEFHGKYIDVQYIASGAETIGWAPAGRLTVTKPYDADKDAGFGPVLAGEWTPVRLETGQLAVFYPEDAHAPKLPAGAAAPVMKIVVKIAIGNISKPQEIKGETWM